MRTIGRYPKRAAIMSKVRPERGRRPKARSVASASLPFCWSTLRAALRSNTTRDSWPCQTANISGLQPKSLRSTARLGSLKQTREVPRGRFGSDPPQECIGASAIRTPPDNLQSKEGLGETGYHLVTGMHRTLPLQRLQHDMLVTQACGCVDVEGKGASLRVCNARGPATILFYIKSRRHHLRRDDLRKKRRTLVWFPIYIS